MGEETILDCIRDWIGSVAFRVFLWSVRMTQEQYFKAVEYECEMTRRTEAYARAGDMKEWE
jgi:hypothetical protein